VPSGAIRRGSATPPRYKWTSDGVVKYDIHGDGKGTYTWNVRDRSEIY
jgi:hypothetical protein